MGKISAAKKIAIPAVLAVAVTAAASLSYFGVIDIPFIDGKTETAVTSSAVISQKETSAVKESTSSKVTESTSENTTETTEATQAPTTEIQADTASLSRLLGCVGGMYDLAGYSSTGKNAYRKILGSVLSPFGIDQVYSLYCKNDAEYFETQKNNFGEEPEEKRDPLGKFTQSYRYGKISADNVDYLIENVFGTVPDRSKAEIKENGSCRVYYLDGFYYFSCEDGGSVGTKADIRLNEASGDGTYNVVYDLYSDDDENTFIGTYKSVCRPAVSDGKMQWTVLSFIEV